MYGCNHLAGFNEIKEWLADLKKDERAYQMCRLPLPNLLLELEKGNGQTYLTDNIAQFLREHNLRTFGGLDDYLEYQLDGSLRQLQAVFRDIRVNAVYSPYYEGVVSIDVTALSQAVNEEPLDCFVKAMKEIMRHATVLLLVSPDCVNKSALKKALTERLSVKEIEVVPYSHKDYALMMVFRLKELGIRIQSIERQKPLLVKLVQTALVANAKEAVHLADQLAHYADYTGFLPVLYVEKTKEMLLDVNKPMTVQEIAK